MRVVSDVMLAIWQSGDFVGDKRPFGRVTIQKPMMALNRLLDQVYATLPYQQAGIPRELPNVKSISWERGVDAEAATCTVVLYNTEPLAPGTHPEGAGVLDLPGWFTYNRGATSYSPSWGHAVNKWQDWIVPDRVLRTYQGYGFNSEKIPELDTNLVCTGTWLIDDVDYSVDGIITVTCRDYARLLLDHSLFPPVVPLVKYPLSFEPIRTVQLPSTTTLRSATGIVTPGYMLSSNQPYYGVAPIFGHTPMEAFDGSASTFFLSVGNQRPDHGYSFEFIQGSLNNAPVKGVKFKVWAGPYRCYVGISVGGVWQGTRTVPYNPNHPISQPNGANEKYVAAFTVAREQEVTHMFKNNGYASVDAVRLTFTSLYDSNLGDFHYRAGVRTFQVVSTSVATVTTLGGTTQEGDYSDYCDVVRLLLAYGGFYWPANTTKRYITRSDGVKVVGNPPVNSAFLGAGASGNVWADIEPSGVAGVGGLGVEIFNNKSIMEAINYIRDIIGYLFFVDENASAVFRVPNIWTVGNYVNVSGERATRTTNLHTIDESMTLLDLRSKLTSRSVRETVFVASVSGKVAAASRGFNPYPAGFRRVAGWSDQNFAGVQGSEVESQKEAQIMADLITVRQMFNYRTNSLQIPGFPGIQIDDQVRIVERVTGEAYIHYVKSITSNWDIVEGSWTYDLNTHWLGLEPGVAWFVDKNALAVETRAFLTALGKT